jgi:hypothetical protein
MTGVIYSIDTGKIDGHLNCLPEHLEGSIPEGFLFYENCPLNMTHIIDNVPTIICYEMSFEEKQKLLVSSIQKYLDTTAKLRNYDSILSLCSYYNSTNPTFAAEAQAGITWRDAVWTYCYQVLSDVINESRTIPTVEELITELPTIVW